MLVLVHLGLSLHVQGKIKLAARFQTRTTDINPGRIVEDVNDVINKLRNRKSPENRIRIAKIANAIVKFKHYLPKWKTPKIKILQKHDKDKPKDLPSSYN